MPRSGPTRHVFAWDGYPPEGLRKVRWCGTCNLAENNAIHDVPEVSDEERAVTARIVGERA